MFASRTFFLSLPILLSLMDGRLAAAQKPYEELVPEGSTLFFTLRNVSDVTKWFEASPLAEAWKSPEMTAFVKQVTSTIESKITQANKDWGNAFGDLKEICQGEVALAIGDPSSISFTGEVKEFPVAVLMDVGAKKDKAAEFLKKQTERLTEDGKRRKTETEFRGQKITILEKDDSKEKGPSIAVCLADDLLALSLSKPFLQDILANRSESAVKPLSQHADYKALREKYGKAAALFCYVHLGRWLDILPKAVKASGEANEMQIGMFTKAKEFLGLSTLRALTASVVLSESGAKQTLFLSAPGTPKGLLKILWTKPQALRFPSLVPDDAQSATVFQLDFEAVLKVIEDAAQMAAPFLGQPSGEGQPGMLQLAEQQLGINFKQDLIAPLSGQVIEYERIKKPFSQSGGEIAFLIELKDKQKFQATVDKLLLTVPVFKKVEYLGRPLYVFGQFGSGDADDAKPGSSDEKAGSSSPTLGLIDTHFIFGTSKNAVEEVIRRVGKEVKSINDTPGFKAVAGSIPPSAICLSYQSPEVLEYIIFMAKELGSSLGYGDDDDDNDGDDNDDDKKNAHAKKKGKTGGGADALREAFKKLPDGSIFSKNLAGILSTGFVEEGGIGYRQELLFKKKGSEK